MKRCRDEEESDGPGAQSRTATSQIPDPKSQIPNPQLFRSRSRSRFPNAAFPLSLAPAFLYTLSLAGPRETADP